MSKWYKLSIEETTQQLDTHPQDGLADVVVTQRLQKYGHNELVEKGAKSIWAILWEQLSEIMVVLLILSAGVSAYLGELNEAIVIIAIVILNAILGLTQEYRAEQAIAALKKLAVPTVRVKRNGRIQEISARDLVPGDLVLLEAGNFVPADGRLVECANLRVEEAALTGESEAVEKYLTIPKGDNLPLGDQHNMVFMGTVITYGRGTAVITETGMTTQLGHIAALIQKVEQEDTPLQRRLDQLGKTLAGIALVIIAIVVLQGFLRIYSATGTITTEDIGLLFRTAISLAVAAVPEGLPAVVAITLALGSQRMLKRNALIRKLPAVETLGSVTVICSDKTGTLTENKMTVTVLDVAGRTEGIQTLANRDGAVFDPDNDVSLSPEERNLAFLIKVASLCNDAVLQDTHEGVERVIGDPTEGALVVAAAKMGFQKGQLESRWPRVAEIPFTSERKRMTTIHQASTQTADSDAPWRDAPYVAFCKGAVDGLLDITNGVWDGGKVVPLDTAMRQRITESNEGLAKQGQRVLGVAYRPLSQVASEENAVEADMVFIGLVGMIDPPRPEVKHAVSTARSAGIRPVMITGDHPLTAQHIAKDLGIAQNGRNLTGQQLTTFSPEDLKGVVEEVPVYARVSPEHKLNIVEALQAQGHIVAMTGDGVNDAPALKKADIGVAMGITGTDVSKEAADMVLLDDNFATIVAAIEEGRIIFDNIRKFIQYILSSNTGELLVMFISPFLGMPLALLPLQILWVNLVTDGLPGLALAVEKAEPNIMQRGPFSPKESIFSRGLGQRILWIGALVGLVSLGVGYFSWLANPNGHWQTMIFTTLTFAQLGNVLAIRSNRYSLFSIGLMSNQLMVAAVFITFILQMILIYVPVLGNFFHIEEPLTVMELLTCLAVSSIVFLAVEFEKWLMRQRG